MNILFNIMSFKINLSINKISNESLNTNTIPPLDLNRFTFIESQYLHPTINNDYINSSDYDLSNSMNHLISSDLPYIIIHSLLE